MAYDSLTSLAKTIEEFLIHGDQFPFSLPKYQNICQDIKSIHHQATSMLAFFLDSPNKTISLERRVKDVANKVEDGIQFFMSQKNRSNRGGRKPTFKLKRDLRKAAEEMNSIFGKMEIMEDSVTIQDPPPTLSAAAANSSSKLHDPVDFEDDLMRTMEFFIRISSNLDFLEFLLPTQSGAAAKDDPVGLVNDFHIIMKLLVGESPNLEILPIVGTGGIGKTTLARYVYHHPLIIPHFDIRAWVTVSQSYSREGILSSLLVSMGVQREGDIISMSSHVYESLKGRRYLVVMDDVWNTMVWDDIKTMFPDDGNRSRIILTTRELDVAAHIMPPCYPPHQMNLMDDDQSWYLLRNKVFGDQDCPHEFELIGRKIARGCGGLPLSIVIMADLLSSITMTLDSWEAIAEDVISSISTKGGQLDQMMSSSFMALPHHLRSCLLYMGGFPKHYEFRVSELSKLWIAEGFIKVKPDGPETLEEVAEDYVEDLVNKSLVTVTSRKYNGKIKSCSLHDVVRDFCVRKVQEDKFFLPVEEYLPDTTLRRYFLPKILKNQRRMSLTSYDLHLRETIHNSTIRTVICIQQGAYLPVGSVQSFPLLRVLHVVNKSDYSGWEPGQVFELTHLRYLASSIPSCIPAAILKLQNLQTLIIYRHNVRLPEEIWRLTQLRHLIAFSFHPLPHPQLETCPLESLQTLSLASNFECSETILLIIPYLRKLGICYSEHAFHQDYHLNNLSNLHQLENLKLKVHKDFCFGQELNHVIPLTLKKLSLSGCRLPWKDMTIVGSLPKLEVLKLRDFAFQGAEWETTEGEFTKLKFLLVDKSDLERWITDSTHFPVLKSLRLYQCPQLWIPNDIGDIETLELIEVDVQNGSLVVSAKQIQKDQGFFGNDSLQVQVKHF